MSWVLTTRDGLSSRDGGQKHLVFIPHPVCLEPRVVTDRPMPDRLNRGRYRAREAILRLRARSTDSALISLAVPILKPCRRSFQLSWEHGSGVAIRDIDLLLSEASSSG
jgi:hypothetical protein